MCVVIVLLLFFVLLLLLLFWGGGGVVVVFSSFFFFRLFFLFFFLSFLFAGEGGLGAGMECVCVNTFGTNFKCNIAMIMVNSFRIVLCGCVLR